MRLVKRFLSSRNLRSSGRQRIVKKVFVILAFLPMILLADVGETGATFLNLDVGASAIAMGGAVTSLGSGVHSLFWNPGGLGWLNGSEVTVMHTEHFQSIRFENLGYAFGFNSIGIGFSLKGLHLGGMEERTGPSATPLSTFGAYFIAPSLCFAKSFGNHLSLGTNIKLVYQSIDKYNAITFGDDIGLSIRNIIGGLGIGFTVTNFGTKIKFSNSAYSLPTRVRGGLSYSLFDEKVILGFDVLKPLTEDIQYCFGAEGRINENIILRAGYKSGLQDCGNLAGIASGVGLKIGSLDIDYAFSMYGMLGLTHSFSISYIFGRKKEIGEYQEQRIEEELQRRARLTAEAFYNQGLMQQKEGKYEQALKNFDVALIWAPTYEEASQAVELLKKKIREREINEHLTRGIAEFRQGRYIEAIVEFGAVLELDSVNAQAKAWFNAASDALIKVHMERIKFEKEIEDKISQYLNDGFKKFSKKEYKEAIELWNNILAFDPTHEEALKYIAKAKSEIKKQINESLERVDSYILEDKFIMALSEVDRILSLESDKTALLKRDEIKKKLRSLSIEHTQKGIEFYKQKKFGPAETEFKMALNFDASNTTAKNYLAKIKPGRKEVSEGDIEDLYMKGVTAYTQEKFQLAVFYWKRVLEIDPRHANAKRNIERAEEKLKIYKK